MRILFLTLGILLSSAVCCFAQNVSLSKTLSSDDVTSIVESPDGSIWMGTTHGLNNYLGSVYYQYYASSSDNSLKDDEILCLDMDSQGRLLVGTTMGLSVFDGNSFRTMGGNFIRPIKSARALDENTYVISDYNGISTVDSESLEVIRNVKIRGAVNTPNVAVTKEEEIWVVVSAVSNREIHILDKDLQVRDTLQTSISGHINGIFLTDDGLFWIYNEKTVEAFSTSSKAEFNLPGLESLISGKNISFVRAYKPGTILIGLFNDGLYVYNYVSGAYSHIIQEESLSINSTLPFVDSKYCIWLVKKNSGEIDVFSESDVLKKYSSYLEYCKDKNVLTLGFDSHNNVVVVTRNDFQTIDSKTGLPLFLSSQYKYVNAIYGKNEEFIVQASSGAIVVGTKNTGKTDLKYQVDLPSFPYDFRKDASNNLWVLTASSLYKVDNSGNYSQYDFPFDSKSVFPYRLATCRRTNEVMCFTSNGIYKIEKDGKEVLLDVENASIANCIDRDYEGYYWIGTPHGLIKYDPTTKKSIMMTTENSLPENNVVSVLAGQGGTVWFATTNSICSIKPDADNVIVYSLNTSTKSTTFIRDMVAESMDGTIVFASGDGIVKICKENIASQGNRTVSLKRLYVNDNPMPLGDGQIKLNYKQNSITFEFPHIELNSQTDILYRYMLEGFDQNWNIINDYPVTSYKNLNPGRYTFKVQILNPDGRWSEDAVSQKVFIRRVPFASNVAVVIYFLIGVLFVHLIQRVSKSKIQIRIAEHESNASKNLLDTLTNITHELRTPLTLVYGPVQQLLQSIPKTSPDREMLNVIENNVNRLRVLTDHIIDYSKTKANEESLNVNLINISLFIRQKVDNFRFLGFDKGIKLSCLLGKNIEGWVDISKVETILNNLLSNAIKYTPDGGEISVYADNLTNEGRLVLYVQDSGIGIDEEHRNKIFSRFERLGQKDSEIVGSGIGLNYALYLAQKHKGKLEYKPAPEHGSIFYLTIPIVKAAYDDSEISITPSSFLTQDIETENNTVEDKGRTIVIADDDNEIASYIGNLFKKTWNIQISHNGEEALEMIKEVVPDIVISDVVMPIKDGYNLCRDIRENPDLCHIPIILLTAKDDAKSKLHGIMKGADAYIAKPFDPYILCAEVETIVKNRQRNQSRILNMTSEQMTPENESDAQSDDITLSKRDREFLMKIHSIIDENLEEESFNVASLSEAMRMSYNNLYLKIKTLTGQTPQTYLSTYKMNIAYKLLKEGELTISEVSYKVGASSISSFSRSFKKQFGFPPSEVKDR